MSVADETPDITGIDEPQPDPRELAHQIALEVADEAEHVGDFAGSLDLGDSVTDFRFECRIRGYEGWQWSVTLYHDTQTGRWTVNESSLTPTETALRPPEWVPWKDRLEPTDLAPTDSIGTDPDDPRVEDGELAESSLEDVNDASETFRLTRRHVLSPLGRAQTAKRWYEGPRGPKALSTKTAGGSVCSNCGFFVPLTGELSRMFGVCANKWSPDDGRVVSLDHGCGEHSEILPPEPSRLWVQSKPAFDDLHIDVVAQKPREERGQVELLEGIVTEAVEGAREEHEADETDENVETTEVAETAEAAEAGEAVKAEATETEPVESEAETEAEAEAGAATEGVDKPQPTAVDETEPETADIPDTEGSDVSDAAESEEPSQESTED